MHTAHSTQRTLSTMKKDQRYQRINQHKEEQAQATDEVASSSLSAYRQQQQQQQQQSSQLYYRDDPLQQEQQINNASDTTKESPSISSPAHKLRLRRGPSTDGMSPPGSRSASFRGGEIKEEDGGGASASASTSTSAGRLEKGELQGDSNSGVNHRRKDGSDSSNQHILSNPLNNDLLLSGSSSFDLLDDNDDDDDEINLQLQRYNTNYFDDDNNANHHHEMELNSNENGMYHPRSDTDGSNSKDPWIRMIQHHNGHSPQLPTSGGGAGTGIFPFSSVHSLSDFLLYLHGVRRQARQRRAQRFLTMPSGDTVSEEGCHWHLRRVQFWCLTYFWDATDVGLLVVGILFIVWLFGLLWMARSRMRQLAAAAAAVDPDTAESESEFDAPENTATTKQEEQGTFFILFRYLWWVLGFILLVRILGPFALQNVNNRRRERRRQRYMMSGDMQQQQQRLNQQQFPTMVMNSSSNSGNKTRYSVLYPENTAGADATADVEDDATDGLEITEQALSAQQMNGVGVDVDSNNLKDSDGMEMA